MAGQTIDYDALAKQFGAVSSQPAAAAPAIDYDALAKQHGAIAVDAGGNNTVTGSILSGNAENYLDTQPDARPPVSIPLYNSQGQVKPVDDASKPLNGAEKAALSPLEYLKSGMEQLGHGLFGIGHAESGEQVAGATSDVIRGGLQTLTPFFAPGMLAHPLASAVGMGLFGAAQQTVEKTTGALGLPNGYSRLAGDIAGLWGGAKGYQWLSDMARIPDQRVADSIYKRLELTVDALKDPTLPDGQRAAAKAQAEALLDSLKREEGWPLVPRLFPNPNRQQADAYDYMRNQVGTAPNAGAATGSPFVRGTQWLTGMTLPGAVMDVGAAKQNIEAMRGHSAGLVDQATPETSPGVLYDQFRQAEQNSQPVSVPVRTKRIPQLDSEGRPTGQTTQQPVISNLQMPVDLRSIKPAAREMYDSMQLMAMKDRASSVAYSAAEQIAKHWDDFATASQAEQALSGFKHEAMFGSQGRSAAMAKFLVSKLQPLIDSAAQKYGGDEAMEALQEGRRATAQQAGADWLAEQFQKATAAGGFDRERGLWNAWVQLKPEVKRVMYSPEQVENLNKFFLGVKAYADNPNPSGSALVGTIAAQGAAAMSGAALHPTFWLSELGAGGVAKLLRSDAGIKLLTEGLRIPRTSPRAAALEQQLRQILNNPPSGPVSPPPTGGGGAGTSAAERVKTFLKGEEGGAPTEPRGPAISPTEKAPGVPRPAGPLGPIYEEFHHDAQAALEHFKNHATGDAIGALYHP
ncbi:MAG TPA: hypothetical protein VME43_04385, partial [Bryobacteraceae bacterium]|nr:hypothetical protein [Bryobacteraceae bacterium]